MISFSRLYIGVHYPSDVLAGAATGTVVAIFVHGVFNRLILKGIKGIDSRYRCLFVIPTGTEAGKRPNHS